MDKNDILRMIDEREHLAHYGIKGQKHGVRRWQNEDGSLTPEGKIHYGIGEGIKEKNTKYSKPSIENAPKEVAFNPGKPFYKTESGKKSIKDIADLGLETLIQEGENIYRNDVEKYRDSYRFWFIYEDQTIGLPQITSLIQAGYSSDDISKMIDNVVKESKNKDFDPYENFNFAVMEGGPDRMKAWAKSCENVWKKEQNKVYFRSRHMRPINHSEQTDNFLAHYGIKGQEWGKRRFQNEDGSLTPEGRRRYGLKSDYSNMTDQQLREAINKKRTQNQYVDLMTKDARKKKEDIAGFIRSASDVAGKSIDIIDKTALDKQRSLLDEQISDYKEVKDANQKLLDKANSHNQKIDNAIVKNKRLEAAGKPQKDLTELGNKVDTSKLETAVNDAKERQEYFQTAKDNLNKSKDLAKTSMTTTGQSADMISKLSTKGELQEKTAEAIRNIQEMDEDQLKKTVDRIMLEKQYDELINPPKPSAWARGREIMQSVGSALGIILSIVTIASIAKGLKSKGVAQSDENGEFLSHYRTPGSKNGVRRYQNEDGTLTPEGYRHYGIDPNGRQAADPRAIIERQRAQIQAQRMQQKAQAKQNAYTRKIAQRQALREARNQSRIQNVYAQQQLREQRAQNEEELRAKAENRENIRKNVIKGVAATAAIAVGVMVARHIIKEGALNNAHMRDMEKTSLLGKQRMAELTEQNKLEMLKEKNAANAMKESIKKTPTNVEIPKTSIPKVETPITPKKSNDDIFKKTKKEFKEIRKSQKGWIADSGLNLEKEGEASLAALKKKKVYNAPVAEAYKIYEPTTGGYIIKKVKSLIHSDSYIAIWEIGKTILNRCFLIEQKS